MIGHYHPITTFLRASCKVFQDLGFEIVEGPEIEEEKYNFDLLRIPKTHPARDVQDTFFLKDGRVLRTHTSPVQIRAMETRKPPVRIIVPGRCYRHEATDATHEATFYQLEGFAIDKDITMANLIWILDEFVKKIFGPNIKTKIFPAYYPFVEPGMDLAIFYKGRWLEILGSGMIHPEVLQNMGINPQEYQGFAFGMGIDRLLMILTGMDDIRMPYQGDFRFLKQF
jgi:phenylalanyl-tRNA synthetase alpha chain